MSVHDQVEVLIIEKAIGWENAVLAKVTDLETELGLVKFQAQGYKEDFDRERRDRAEFHGKKEDEKQQYEHQLEQLLLDCSRLEEENRKLRNSKQCTQCTNNQARVKKLEEEKKSLLENMKEKKDKVTQLTNRPTENNLKASQPTPQPGLGEVVGPQEAAPIAHHPHQHHHQGQTTGQDHRRLSVPVPIPSHLSSQSRTRKNTWSPGGSPRQGLSPVSTPTPPRHGSPIHRHTTVPPMSRDTSPRDIGFGSNSPSPTFGRHSPNSQQYYQRSPVDQHPMLLGELNTRENVVSPSPPQKTVFGQSTIPFESQGQFSQYQPSGGLLPRNPSPGVARQDNFRPPDTHYPPRVPNQQGVPLQNFTPPLQPAPLVKHTSPAFNQNHEPSKLIPSPDPGEAVEHERPNLIHEKFYQNIPGEPEPPQLRPPSLSVGKTQLGNHQHIHHIKDRKMPVPFDSSPPELSRSRNELEETLPQEVTEEALRVMEEVSGRSSNKKTDIHMPLDYNLECQRCKKIFREGEIQKFRKHSADCQGSDSNQERGNQKPVPKPRKKK